MRIFGVKQGLEFNAARGVLRLLDQTRLPHEEHWLHIHQLEDLREAIYSLRVRGAPAIGVAAAYGLCAIARHSGAKNHSALLEILDEAALVLAAARPTAVNLSAAVQRMRLLWREKSTQSLPALQRNLEAEAGRLHAEEIASTLAIARAGLEIFHQGDGVITHCNTGPLAAPGLGTALGTVLWAQRQGLDLHVFADETRPLLQGGRLTTWECLQNNIPCTLIADNMAAVVMRAGRVQVAVVGADRIAANGDTANKIGTYGLAVLCKQHGVPFYIAAPTTTVDLHCRTGADIPIEERPAQELRGAYGLDWAPAEIAVYNPAFDVTPWELISGLISERGLLRRADQIAGLK